MIELVIIPIISFLTVYALTPKVIQIMHYRGIVGKDMNKLNHPMVAELGGIPIFLGFAFGTITAIFLSTYFGTKINLLFFLAGMMTITLIGFIGTVDDIIGWKKGIRQWQHALFPIIAALPLMAIKVSNPPISLPFIGLLPAEFYFPFGLIYSILLVPIGVTGASNASNMLAGLNGLEAGLAILILSTLGITAFVTGKIEALIFVLAMIGTLVAFLRYNWFPAKIFGGDGLTLMAGASIAVVSILGDMEKIGIALMAIYFIELYLKAKNKFQGECFGIPNKNGTLVAPKEKQSLTHYFMNMAPATEKQVVIKILATQAIICILVLIAIYLNIMQIVKI
jgi:UDP-N-acetylglucosamine--dolichyl-phosphate N-acetylglucosaminephosphotransferase